MTTSFDRNEAALTQAIDRWNAGDLDGYLEIYDDEVQLHGLTPQPMDKSGARGFYEALFAAFPENRLDVHENFGDDDRLASRFTLSGKHGGAFMGVPATGNQIALNGITTMHFREGRVVQRWTTSDMLGLLVQIGAVPPPPA